MTSGSEGRTPAVRTIDTCACISRIWLIAAERVSQALDCVCRVLIFKAGSFAAALMSRGNREPDLGSVPVLTAGLQQVCSKFRKT